MSRNSNRPKFESWGRHPSLPAKVVSLHWSTDFPPPRAAVEFRLVDGEVAPEPALPKMLPVGMGRSYGDICLLANGTLLKTRGLDRFQSLDEQTGILRCEAGVTLDEILDLCVPRGWFLPVTPGTRYVTIGGCIANDVHGKNHHVAGTFGRYVRSLELARSDGSRFICSPRENVAWFRATVGGMGLTGLIVSAEIQLRRVVSPIMRCQAVRFHGLDEFLALSLASPTKEYSTAWMDSTATGRNFARGIFFSAEHSEEAAPLTSTRRRSLSLPCDLPGFTLNRLSVRAFNTIYFRMHSKKEKQRLVKYDSFFYPLDRILHWNRLYGRRGMVQFHCVLPLTADPLAILQLLKAVSVSGFSSFLAVLKVFGDVPSPGILSFPMPGTSMSLDFPIRGEETFDLMDRLARITAENGGRLYPAKDAQMTPLQFQGFYPQWQQFAAYVDPAFSSSLWERVSGRG
jgi:FAD/FMN-containing dehydrogenase